MEKEQSLAVVPGDGAPAVVNEERVRWMRDEVFRTVCDARLYVSSRRAFSQDVYNCSWEGQLLEPRKRDKGNEKAFPFDGASDMRVALANQFCEEKALLLEVAVEKMSFEGVSSEGMSVALEAQALFNFVKKNFLGTEWGDCWRQVFHWMLADAPAAAMVGVFWRDEVRLRYREMDAEGLVAFALQNAVEAFESEGVGDAEEAQLLAEGAVDEVYRLLGGGDVEGLAGWLANVFEGASERSLRRAARDLQARGVCSVPVAEPLYSGPRCAPLRLFEDVFVPVNTRELQDARFVLLREWVSEVELRSRVRERGYSKRWVDAVLERGEGLSFLPCEKMGGLPDSWSSVGDFFSWCSAAGTRLGTGSGASLNRGVFEVLTFYRKAVNEDGVPGVIVSTMHGAVDFLAAKEEVLDYAHGLYPFVLLRHERHSPYVWDSRSVPELAASAQDWLKVAFDSFADHTQISTIPPVKVPANRPNFDLRLGPMDIISESRPGEVSYMTGQQYPVSNERFRSDLLRMSNEFFGRQGDGVSPDLVALVAQGLVKRQMPAVGEVVAQMLQLVAQFMPVEQAAEILGGEEVAAETLARLARRMVVSVDFDARTLSNEWLDKVGTLVGNYLLAWDSDATVNRAAVVRYLAERIDPALARNVLRPVEEASQAEVADEQANFAKIMAGVEPPMVETGQNYALRLQVLEGILEANPETVQRLRAMPNSAAILEARMKHFRGMLEQMENAQIGRLMAKPALG